MHCIRRGKLIVFEGGDGAGTTTQAQLLFHRLQHEYPWTKPIITSEPSSHPIGHFIRELLKGKAADLDPKEMALLFFADRGDHYRSTIAPGLNTGSWVICDRNWQSTLVYQALIQEDILQAHEMTCFVLDLKHSLAFPDADYSFVLDVPWEVTSQRRAGRGTAIEVYEADWIQQRVAVAYRELPEYDSSALLINCGQHSPADIHQLILEYLLPDLKQ